MGGDSAGLRQLRRVAVHAQRNVPTWQPGTGLPECDLMRRAWLERGARALLLVGSLTVALCAAELAMTAWYGELGRVGPWEPAPEWDSPFVFRPRASLVGEVAAREVGPGTLRVLSYGDSLNSGFGVPAGAGYPQQLEASLAGLGERAEVLALQRGNSPTVYSFHLRTDLPRLRPDGVIVEIELMNEVGS